MQAVESGADLEGVPGLALWRDGAVNNTEHRAVVGFDKLPDRLVANVQRIVLLLRLAVLMHRSHDRDPLPVVELDVDGDELLLRLPRRWLEGHPLTRLDLEAERETLEGFGRRLVIRAT